MSSLLDALSDSEKTIDLQDENLITPIHEFLEINPETRLITIPESEKLFGVYGENEVEIKYFKCPRIVLNNIDLYQCYIFINYISASGKIGYIQADTVVLDETENYIIFIWELKRNVFDENIDADIYFSISAKQYLEDKEPVFFTRKAKGNLYGTVYAEEQITEQYADIILQLLAEMDGIRQIATPEAMKDYVDDWLKENPNKLGGQPVPVKSASEMLDTQTLYLYMGQGETVEEVVYEKGYVYYYVEDTQSWTKGNLYGGEGFFGGSAEDVTYDDSGTNLGATDVQGAIGKLSDKVNNFKSGATEQEAKQIKQNTDDIDELRKGVVYVGSGEMPEDYNIQIDPEGSASEVVTREEFENIKVYIVDKGSNDKGHYRKWSDGTLDMWGTSVYTDAIITNQIGSLFYSSIIQLNLPMASLTPVVVNVSAVSNNLVWCYVGSSGDMLNYVQIRLVAPSLLEKNSGMLTYHYFGTWK